MARVYLDYNATAPMRAEAKAAIARAQDAGGNASSVHATGRAARATLEDARVRIARAVNAPADDVVFTSGGTEADNLAVFSVVASGAAKRLLIAATEHDAVLAAAQASGAAVEFIPVNASGVVDLAWLDARLSRWDAEDGRPFIAVMLANNETGVIQPIADIAGIKNTADGLLLVDAVQAFGKIAVDCAALGADYLSLSAHKIGGPGGVGALIVKEGAPLVARQHGGRQERGRRSGTENVAGAAGFAAAADAACASLSAFHALAAQRDAMEARLRSAHPDLVVFGEGAERLANTSAFALPGFASDAQLMTLDLAGFDISSGAACSSGKVRASHVLAAMGVDDALAGCAVRVSLGWSSAPDDAGRFAEAWLNEAARIVARKETA